MIEPSRAGVVRTPRTSLDEPSSYSPTTPWISPWLTTRFTSESARTPGNVLPMPRISRIVSAMVRAGGSCNQKRPTGASFGVPGACTFTVFVDVAVAPSSSVTVRVIVRVPAVVYVLDVVMPVPVVPSPKFQA